MSAHNGGIYRTGGYPTVPPAHGGHAAYGGHAPYAGHPAYATHAVHGGQAPRDVQPVNHTRQPGNLMQAGRAVQAAYSGRPQHALPAGSATRTAVEESQARSRPPVGVLLLGLLIGLLVFGSTGYLVGSTSSGSTVEGETAGGSQEAANRGRVGPLLAPLAEGWIPWLGACLSSSEADGPAPAAGEQFRVKCAVNPTIDVFFVQFASAADRDTARTAKQTENANSARIAAGAAPVVAQRAGASGRTTGAYVEFAYQNDGRTYGGIWWDDSTTTGAAYLEKQWNEGDGGWRPLRDLWQRYT